jgi:hypothetical protein
MKTIFSNDTLNPNTPKKEEPVHNRVNRAINHLKKKQVVIETNWMEALDIQDQKQQAFNKADKEVEETLMLRPDYEKEAWAARNMAWQALQDAMKKVTQLEAAFDLNEKRKRWLQQVRPARLAVATKVDFVAKTLSNVVGKIKLPTDPRRFRKQRHQVMA